MLMKCRYSRSASVAAVAIFFVIGWIVIGTFGYEECRQQSAANQAQEYDASFLIAPPCILSRFIQENRDEIIAAGTVFIAIFTGFLWWSTKRLWEANKQTLQLAREEFTATHRPEIKIISVILADETDVDVRGVTNVVFANVGRSPATIIETVGDIVASDGPPAINAPAPIRGPAGRVLDSGKKESWRMESDSIKATVTKFASADPAIRGERERFCFGRIVYKDSGGGCREAGFCRRLDRETKRWVKVENSEHEYAY
jgi:hypothetical protein